MSIKEAAQAALDAVRQGLAERAAQLLYRHLRNFMIRRLEFGNGTNVVGMSREDAEENAVDAMLRFVESNPGGQAGGLSWLYRCLDSQALDWHRRQRAAKRGGGAEIGPLHDENDNIRPEVEQAQPIFAPDKAPNPGQGDCLERAMTAFEEDHPAYARVLRLVAEGLEIDDIAVEFGADPSNITEQQRKNARQRKSHALKMAREYFDACKD
ncbi:MAG: hypothetical protein JNJ71_19455 [Rubrivivax sp.]|nr:hypothetical protein [Rubrivivax sp.]